MYSQFVGNEWINYSQYYYKFPITRAGIYHLDSNALANSGINVSSFDARNLQLFFRGQEIPIYVQGEGDGLFNGTDFIEFFGEGNDGWIDSAIYENGNYGMLNPALSLFNDTSFYYLTWNNSTSNLRYVLETDTSFSSYTPSYFYIYKIRQSGGTSYYEGEILSGVVTSPEYTDGEGYGGLFTSSGSYAPNWGSAPLNGLKPTLFTLGGLSVPATLEIRISTCNNPLSGPDHHHKITVAGITDVVDDTLNGYTYRKRNFIVNPVDLQSSVEPFRVDFLGDFTTNTRNTFGFYELNLPQQFDLGNRTEQQMYLPDDGAQPKSRLDITNFNPQSSACWIFNITDRKKILTVNNAGTIQALVPNNGSGSPKRMYISSDAAVTNISQVYPVSNDITHFAQFRDFENSEGNKDYVIITHRSLWNSASLYENLRSVDHQSTVIDIEELYDQFGFGVRKHPNSIRNFLKMTNAEWTTKPEHVFLLGKGIKHNLTRFNPTYYSRSLVPTIGVAPTDNMYSYNIAGDTNMYCAIGRLAATSDTTVINYYNKVLCYESNQNISPKPEWQKHILHFASDPTFEYAVDNYQNIIEDSLYGAYVTKFVKNGVATFPINTADSVRTFLNEEGVSLVTVFGHSSGSGFEFTVDQPEQMYNNCKYPWYVVNGCLSGDLFDVTPLISERFVLTAEKGAIGFIANTSVGLAGYLTSITSEFYQNIAVDDYYKTVGIAHQHAVDPFLPNVSYNTVKTNALDFQIHGDPALKMNSDSLPDIDLKVENVSFEPPIVTMEMDSFKMKIIVTNLGRAITTPYSLVVTRNFPEPGVANAIYPITRNSIYYKDTVELWLPISYSTSFGINQFHIEADLPSFIPESNGLEVVNNVIDLNMNIISSDIVPVYPYKYAVIPRNHTWLKASTGDPFAPAKNYKFELDTTDLFNSPFLRDTIINQSGGVVQWDPGMLLDSIAFDSAAYFWRVGVDSANTGNYYRFKESTFQFITGKYGWGQDHFFQFKDDSYTYIDYNRPFRRFDFVPDYKELKVTNYPYTPPGDGGNFATEYLLGGGLQEESGCVTIPGIHPRLYVFVIDPITLEPWKSHCPTINPGGNNQPSHNFGNANNNCGCHGGGNPASTSARAEKVFMFELTNPAQQDSLVDMLLNDIPDDYFVGVYSFSFLSGNVHNFGSWSPSLINAFDQLGANVDSLQNMHDNNFKAPYIFYTRMGDTTSTIEVVGTDAVNPISLTTTLQNNWSYGTIYSELVGPASEWKSFHWQEHSIDPNPAHDAEFVRIIGVQANGTETVLLDNITSATTDIYSLNTLPGFDASLHPYLKLFMYTRDDSSTTPSQINHWHVMYEGVPECALSPNLGWGFDGDTSYQGQNVNFHVSIQNIGDYDMDSLQIRYSIVDANNSVHDYFVIRDSLRVGDVLVDTFTVANGNYPGNNIFYVEANPYTSRWQNEQFHFNNIGSLNMFVDGDKLNPLLDVTFDGIHIMDGDIVSGKPLINIQIKDENVLRLLDDTTGFEMYLKYPGQSTLTKINFSNPVVTFTPATTPENYAKIDIRPDLTSIDGMYELLVRAQDKSGNNSGWGDSGIYDYKIRFEVINHSTITNIFNFPNPFSTSTQWVFTLTGSEIPTDFTIRIMTISGVVVREITLNELGPIHVGNNVTSFKWNGTDEYGDKLATGVYIYQVITKINGETIDHRSTSADKYFKNNFGKLYILR